MGIRRNFTLFRLIIASLMGSVYLLVAVGPSAAAETWTPRSSGTPSDLYGVAATGPATAWVVGSRGTILKTTDAGNHWIAQPSGTTDTLTGIAAVDSQTAWSVGLRGAILKTTDGGTHWTTQFSHPDGALVGVAAAGPDVAWAIDGGSGAILNTSDGGQTWTVQYEYGYPLTSVTTSDANNAWAVGQAGAVLSTTDGGQSWNPGWCNYCHFLSGVTAVSQDTLWTVGRAGVIARSEDGGMSWQVQDSGMQADLQAIAALDANTAWVVAHDGTILKTSDGGTTWTAQATSATPLRAMAVSGPEAVYAVGDAGTVLATTTIASAPEATSTPSPEATAPPAASTTSQPTKWNGWVTIVQDFSWKGSASAGRESYAGEGAAQLTTKLTFKDSVATANTSFAGNTRHAINGTGSPCNYEITRTENGSAALTSGLEASLALASGNQLALNISVLPDPMGSIDVEDVSRNYGGESCFTEVDRRQFAFGSNNTSLEGFFRELQYELEHSTFTTDVPVGQAAAGGMVTFTATGTSTKDMPTLRAVSMPDIIQPGRVNLTITWDLQSPGS